MYSLLCLSPAVEVSFPQAPWDLVFSDPVGDFLFLSDTCSQRYLALVAVVFLGHLACCDLGSHWVFRLQAAPCGITSSSFASRFSQCWPFLMLSWEFLLYELSSRRASMGILSSYWVSLNISQSFCWVSIHLPFLTYLLRFHRGCSSLMESK